MIRGVTLCIATALALGMTFPAPAGAQWYNSPEPALNTPTTVEAWFGQLRPAQSDIRSLDVYGGRVLWRLSSDRGGQPLLFRSLLGPFIEVIPSQNAGFRSTHAGAHADVRVLASPLAGMVDPVVSLGTGVIHTRASFPLPGAPVFAQRTNTSVALSPAVGLRLGLTPNAALRGDVRDLIILRDGAQHNVTYAVGLGLTF